VKQFIQDNGGALAILGVAMGILAAWGEWRISTNISEQLAAQDTLSASDMALYTTRQESIQEDIGELKQNDQRIDDKLDRIVDILLEDE